MGLSLVVGPAHVGKVALLLERYLGVLDQSSARAESASADSARLQSWDPWLVVPNRVDVDSVERDLVSRRPALLAGTVGTFDDLFRHLAGDELPTASDAQRTIAVRRAVARVELGDLSSSSATAGFADTLLQTIGELEAGLVDAAEIAGDVGRLATAYREELATLGLRDRDGMRRGAVERLRGELDAWSGAPVLAYGFEDLTGAEWALLEALAARADVTVSIPYEPGRAAFEALERTVEDLAELASGRIEELRRVRASMRPAALAHLERELFGDGPSPGPPLDGAIRFLEGAGARGTVELLSSEVVALVRGGMSPDRIAVVCDSPERWGAPLRAALGHVGVPHVVEHGRRLGESALGRALLAVLRYDWLGGSRGDLFAFLRSPFSGLERRSVDFVEGRLRGRAVSDPVRVEEESERLRGAPVPALVGLRGEADRVVAAHALLETMIRNAWGLDAHSTTEDTRVDARAYRAAERTLVELRALVEDGACVGPEDVVTALERTRIPPDGPTSGHLSVLDHERARTRAFDVVFVLGLEEGTFPRRTRPSPLLSDDDRQSLGGRLARPDAVARDRYLFYTTCTRPTQRLVLVREAAGDEGTPREPSPFWEDVRSLFDEADVQRATRRRPLSALTWSLESAPSERERLRALVRLAADDSDGASALAAANDWSRRLDRARNAFDRTTALRSRAVTEPFAAKKVFSATELERFADCSSAWLFERVIDPKKIDAEPDPMLRGQVLHTTLNRFYSMLPRELDSERVTAENLEAATALVHRCLDDALESGVRLDLTELQEAELRHTLRADLEGFLRDEAASEVGFLPRRLEVAFGSDRAAPELQRGLPLADDLWLSGKIDRIDIDPFSARGIVQDYKSGKGAHSARQIDRELRLQIPLYILALRDLVGVEPLGGVYRALAGQRLTRGMLREESREDLPGFAREDYLDEETFWSQVESARERAADNAHRIQKGDVRHDPKGDGCPAWCDLWPMCRVARA
ncbi:MAG TPA: PD-(D/E)XK nuclease family protein [Gaiellaceae bacterium]|nr:PD-(D/E)XK nuclease family protein [Gaiellaceae bacterium]